MINGVTGKRAKLAVTVVVSVGGKRSLIQHIEVNCCCSRWKGGTNCRSKLFLTKWIDDWISFYGGVGVPFSFSFLKALMNMEASCQISSYGRDCCIWFDLFAADVTHDTRGRGWTDAYILYKRPCEKCELHPRSVTTACRNAAPLFRQSSWPATTPTLRDQTNLTMCEIPEWRDSEPASSRPCLILNWYSALFSRLRGE